MTKIAVIVNKNWEAEAVVSALVNSSVRPMELPFPSEINIPPYNTRTAAPRLRFKLERGIDFEAVLWCTQDVMFYDKPYKPEEQNGSSSEEKYRVLPKILSDYDPDLVISVSTAGYPGESSRNGSVVIGGNFFMHNGNPDNPLSKLDVPEIGKLMESNVNDAVFSIVNQDFKNSVEPKFLKTPRNPCDYPCCIASKVFTALSVINVTDYAEYNWADPAALAHYLDEEKKYPCASMETTHGVVKICTDKPIIFVSPITDRFGHFDFEVTPTQNYASSFNAGIVVGRLLLELKAFAEKSLSFNK